MDANYFISYNYSRIIRIYGSVYIIITRKELVSCLRGFEPPTFGTAIQRSIQLSYRHIIGLFPELFLSNKGDANYYKLQLILPRQVKLHKLLL